MSMAGWVHGRVLALGVLGLAHAHAAGVMVFAAASLTDALKEISADYQKSSGNQVHFNFAASSFLARQIEEGAPADIFFSADEARMRELDQKGLIDRATRKSVLSNSLVVVVSADSPWQCHAIGDLASPALKRIALADPRTVPAGIYAREYLEKIGLWQSLRPKVVPLGNVRAALAAVESGDIEAGMVYQTDALISKRVRIAYRVPRADTPAISYPVAVLKGAAQPTTARRFVKYLESAHARLVFEKFGFMVQ